MTKEPIRWIVKLGDIPARTVVMYGEHVVGHLSGVTIKLDKDGKEIVELTLNDALVIYPIIEKK